MPGSEHVSHVSIETWQHLTIRLLAIAILIARLEDLYTLIRGGHAGLMDWEVLQLSSPADKFRWLHAIRPLLHDSTYIKVLFVEVLMATWLISHQQLGLNVQIPLAFLCFSMLLQILRSQYGMDGSLQMASLILPVVFLSTFLEPGYLLIRCCVFYIGIQCILSYFIAGVAKCFGGVWRDGSAITLILGSKIYGTPTVAAYLRKNQLLGQALTYSVLLFEVSFPLAVLLPLPGLLSVLIFTTCFHAACAVLMGLNTFLFTFVACYPSVVCLWLILWRPDRVLF